MLIEFEYGNKILFNMQRLIKTIPFHAFNDIECFKRVTVEDKAIFWDTNKQDKTLMPIRLTVDNILFKIRD